MLPPYVPSAEERASPALYAANVRAKMAEALGWPAVDQGLAELVALKKGGVQVDWMGSSVLVRGSSKD